MKIIITGATGFLGRNIAESFHKDGIQIITTGRSLTVGDELGFLSMKDMNSLTV